MNVKEYIASGQLELYALGLLSEHEMFEVDAQIAKHPELEGELESIFAVNQGISEIAGIGPSRSLKGSILSEIKGENKSVQTKETFGEKLMPTIGVNKPSSWMWAAAASFTLFMVSGAMAAIFYFQLGDANALVAQYEEENQKMAETFQRTSNQYDAAIAHLDVLRKPKSKKITLKGLEMMPEGEAMVYWDPAEKKVLLDAMSMPKAPDDHIYQLWALEDGKPVDAGLFDSFEDGIAMVEMKNISNAQAFAVTIELIGGSESPTMDRMVLFASL